MTLTKADMVANVYAKGMLTKAEASQAVEKALGLIKDVLASGEEVLVSGFGKWTVRYKTQRRGRNPQTGDPLVLPPRKVVTFRPSRVLKSKVQGGDSGSENAPAQSPEKSGGPDDSSGPSGIFKPGYF
jgi:integration host factor subunit alpha